MAEKFSQQAVLEPGTPALTGRATLGATIGNMLEFYDFITYSFFAIQIGHTFFPFAQPVCQPDAVAGDVRRRFRHPADRRARDRVLFRPGGPAAGDDPELCHDGVRHHRAGADALLRCDRYRRADHRHRRADGAGLFARWRGRTHYGLSDGSGAAGQARARGFLAAGEPANRRNRRRAGRRGAFESDDRRRARLLWLAHRLSDRRDLPAVRPVAAHRPARDDPSARD